MKKSVKIIIVSIILLFVMVARAYAATPIDITSLNFDSIPDTTSGGSGSTQVTTKEPTKTETPSKNTQTTSKTSSGSKEKIPATGSNAEILFAAGLVVLVVAGVVAYKKQSIKIK